MHLCVVIFYHTSKELRLALLPTIENQGIMSSKLRVVLGTGEIGRRALVENAPVSCGCRSNTASSHQNVCGIILHSALPSLMSFSVEAGMNWTLPQRKFF